MRWLVLGALFLLVSGGGGMGNGEGVPIQDILVASGSPVHLVRVVVCWLGLGFALTLALALTLSLTLSLTLTLRCTRSPPLGSTRAARARAPRGPGWLGLGLELGC